MQSHGKRPNAADGSSDWDMWFLRHADTGIKLSLGVAAIGTGGAIGGMLVEAGVATATGAEANAAGR